MLRRMTKSALLYAASILLPASGAYAQALEPPPRLTPEQLASQIRGRDLSTDPLAVQESSFELLRQPVQGANAVIQVRFNRLEQNIPRKLAIALEDTRPPLQQTWLRDDGAFPDRTASDGLFHALAPVNLARILDRRLQAERAGLVGSGGMVNVAPFDGRRKLARRPFLLAGSQDLMPGKNIPFGGFGLAALVPERTLIAYHTSVVNDLNRTFNPCRVPAGDPNGKWTFKYLMQQMANTPVTGVTVEQLTRAWVDTFGVGQTVNGNLPVGARPRLKQFIIDPWIAASGGPLAPLNLDIAPFELLAIVNRVDLRSNSSYGGRGGIGELRFVFQVVEPGTCNSEGFTVIFEFGVPGSGCLAAQAWAAQWAALPAMPSAAYNTALEAITEQVVVSGAAPGKPAGSALNQLRTNERYEGMAPVDDNWQMREYKLVNDARGGLRLRSHTIVRTPLVNYNGADKLLMRDFINNNEAQVLLERHSIGLTYPGDPARLFLAAEASNFVDFFWNPTGVFNGNARHKFSLNTCNGCHSDTETDTPFLHIRKGPVNVQLSGFLTGVTVADPVDGTLRDFDDLERRAAHMESLLNNSCIVHGLSFAPVRPH
jgi:hypothetical protein